MVVLGFHAWMTNNLSISSYFGQRLLMLPLKTLGKEQKSIKKGFSLIRTINLEKKKRNIQQSKLSLNLEVDFGILLYHMPILCMGSRFVFFFLLFSRELIFLLTGQKSFAICELMGGGSLKRKCWQRLTQNFQPLWHKLQGVNIYFVLFLYYWPRQRSKWASSSIIQIR